VTGPATDPTSLARMTVFDWVGVLLVASSGLFGLAFPLFVAPVFRKMTEQMGASPIGLGAVLLGGWLPVLVGAFPLALVVLALGVRQGLGRRRLLLGLAFLLTVVEALVLLIGMYGLYFTVIDSAGRGG
jgi:hypothetical protein